MTCAQKHTYQFFQHSSWCNVHPKVIKQTPFKIRVWVLFKKCLPSNNPMKNKRNQTPLPTNKFSSTWYPKHQSFNGCFLVGWFSPNLYIEQWLEITKHLFKTGCLGFHIYIYMHIHTWNSFKKMPFHSFVLCLWMSRRIFQSKQRGHLGPR